MDGSQAPPSMGFSRQKYWSGVPLPSPDIDTSGSHFEEVPGDSERQGSLVCCSSWGHRVGHDFVTEQQELGFLESTKVEWSVVICAVLNVQGLVSS